MPTKLKTINLKGREYVQVDTRVEYFNQTYPNGSITTSYTRQDGAGYIFVAKVTPDTSKPERFFIGHSYGEVGREKAMEKLETVAVGRALAFMGIGIVEGIASADEISKWQETKMPYKKPYASPKKQPAQDHFAGLQMGGPDPVLDGSQYGQ